MILQKDKKLRGVYANQSGWSQDKKPIYPAEGSFAPVNLGHRIKNRYIRLRGVWEKALNWVLLKRFKAQFKKALCLRSVEINLTLVSPLGKTLSSIIIKPFTCRGFSHFWTMSFFLLFMT